MATPIRTTLLIITTLIVVSTSSYCQERQGKYLHLDYLDIDQNEETEFLEQLTSSFIPIQEARKKNDKIDNWYIYRVTYPGTQNSFYNYVVITVSESVSGFEDVPEQYGNLFADQNGQRITENYKRFLTPNHSELWKVRNSVMKNDNFKPSRYIVMNFMNVGLGLEYEYQMFEDEVARPLHETRMARDQMLGWELKELITPGGLEYGYNFATTDYFDKLEHIEFGFTEELIRHTHPDTNISEFFDNIYRTRDLVRSEVWELVKAL